MHWTTHALMRPLAVISRPEASLPKNVTAAVGDYFLNREDHELSSGLQVVELRPSLVLSTLRSTKTWVISSIPSWPLFDGTTTRPGDCLSTTGSIRNSGSYRPRIVYVLHQNLYITPNRGFDHAFPTVLAQVG